MFRWIPQSGVLRAGMPSWRRESEGGAFSSAFGFRAVTTPPVPPAVAGGSVMGLADNHPSPPVVRGLPPTTAGLPEDWRRSGRLLVRPWRQ
jgi:hypothetical protein